MISTYAEDLEDRNFDSWGDETDIRSFLDYDEWTSLFPKDCGSFFRIAFGQVRITFAIDEHGTLWAAEGWHDLTDLGFQRAELDQMINIPQLN